MKTAMKAPTVREQAARSGRFSLFLAAAEQCGFNAILDGKTGITVFAPTDDAFRKLGKEKLNEIMGDRDRLSEIVAYHIVSGRLSIGQIMELRTARSIQGEQLSIYACDGVTVNGARVVEADIECGNGVIHGIDDVLAPPANART